MRRYLALGWLACLLGGGSAAGQTVLFVGNSFTYSPTGYNASGITDANGTHYGGVPGIFQKMATEGGYGAVAVTIEAVGGATLAYHEANKAGIIGQSWDWVVLQEYSTRPLASPSGDALGTNVPAFRNAAQSLAGLVRSANSGANLLLYETWARPDKVLAGYFPNLAAMQTELQLAYSQAASDFGLAGYAAVGDAFLAAIEAGYADDPSLAGAQGPVSLWAGDNYHQNNYGAYLAAAVFYAEILGADPRLLPTGPGSAAAGLGLNALYAAQLLDTAHQVAMPIPEPASTSLAVIGSLAIFMRRRRSA